MIIIRRQNKKPDYDGKPIICAVQNNKIIKTWKNQAEITRADLAELQAKDNVKSLLRLTDRELRGLSNANEKRL